MKKVTNGTISTKMIVLSNMREVTIMTIVTIVIIVTIVTNVREVVTTMRILICQKLYFRIL